MTSSPQQLKKRIILHGWLKNYSAEPIEAAVSSVAEAIRYLQQLFPDMARRPMDKRVTVQVAGFHSAHALTVPTDKEELHIVPAFFGAGGSRGGFMQILIGAIVIVGAFFTGGLTYAWAAAVSASMYGAGAAMILGGLLSFISPAPSRDTARGPNDPDGSKYLGANGNTTQIGTRIPIGYGMFRVDGHYLSFDVQAKDVTV